jgi:hypothetical protein
MPAYAIAREYKLPIYQHLIIEAPDLPAACRQAIDYDDWQTSSEDYDGCGPTYLTAAVAVPEHRAGEDGGHLLYSDLPYLEIPAEFADDDEQKPLSTGGEGGTVHVLVIAHQLHRDPFCSAAQFIITSAHRSRAGATAALAVFCRQHWMDLFDDDAEIPTDDTEMIEKFFAASDGQASYEITLAPLCP